MNIIILNSRRGQSLNLRLPRHLHWLLVLLLLVVPVVGGFAGWQFANYLGDPVFNRDMASRWQQEIEEQRVAVGEVNQRSEKELRALTIRLAEMQARLVRLDALGERLVDVAGIASEEFDFGVIPGLGGPENGYEADSAPGAGESIAGYRPPAFMDQLQDLATTLDRREQQLAILEKLMDSRRQTEQSSLSGRPVKRGWMSSRFGSRTDPFSGRVAVHGGVDFAAREGTEIYATGAGVVTYSGRRWGYGNLIEINHGNGLSTRYAHNKENVVSVGDIVRAGELIGLVGSTGRSTGPHVHYEVLKDGRQIDPMPYISRKR